MAKTTLPSHIRQLVDKNNFVIAIKTLSQEQNISLDQAKTLIDDYEASQKSPQSQPHPAKPNTPNAFTTLKQNLDTHLTQENIKLPLIPYWVKRVMVILLIIGVLGWLMWRTFG